ncbi:MAG: 4'-phosphopantetheinyl transferase superfamily protein [Bacteroidota bacterium]|nr:4'-phosphopantetheinyl transferase superfamily protein [Bacteroidota bacterium]
MPLFYEHINDFAKIAIWHIAEERNFFLKRVLLQNEITHPHKQLQHLAGRYLLQYLHPEFPYHLIEIADTRKPFLPNEEYHFSISHCGEYAAVIVSKDYCVGIDIELIKPKVEKIKYKFLSEDELNNIQYSTFNTQHLTLLWCCKEAVFKWYGSGGVDFKKNIHLDVKNIVTNDGMINCDFIKEEKISLQINYKFFNGMCLAWVQS